MVITRDPTTSQKTHIEISPSQSEEADASGSYLSLVGLSRARLEKLVSDSSSLQLDFSAIEERVAKITAMNKTLLAVETLISKLRTECTRLENLNSAWLSLMSGINDKTEKDEENQLFKKSSAKFVPVLDAAYTMSSDLETRKIELRASIDQELAPIQAANQVQTAPLTQLNPTPQSPMFKFPPLVLEQFDGNILTYRGWKERMHTAFIDRPELPNDVKIMLTANRLIGDAAGWISGIKLVGDNLQLIWRLLDEHCGDDQQQRIALHKKLQSLSCKNESVAASRVFCDELESTLRLLENAGEDTENTYLNESLKSKLPRWILTEILSSLAPNSTVKELRKKVQDLIRKREEIDRYRSIYQPAGHSESTRNDKGRDKRPSREVVSAVTAEPSQKPAQRVNGQKDQRHKFEQSNQRSNNDKRHFCLICEAYGHGTTRCPKNPTAKSKATALMAKKRCMKCAKTGHKSSQCPKPMICSHCKQGHPSFTCRTLDQVNGQSTVAAVTNVDCSDDNDAAVVAAITSVVAATNQAPAQEQMEVLLLSSEVTIANPHTTKNHLLWHFSIQALSPRS